MVHVDSTDVVIPGRVWYLPHFSTYQRKFRIVYDGSTRSKLIYKNNATHLLQTLPHILACFREGKYSHI